VVIGHPDLPATDSARNQVEDLASRWQMELSVRYVF
jgi:hypothetical protein